MCIRDSTYTTLVESGFLNIDGPDAIGDAMISADHKKFGPAFYGLQMLHIVAHNPGDALLDAHSSSLQLSVHASRRRDGIFGLMLVNTDTKSTANVKVSLKGGSVGEMCIRDSLSAGEDSPCPRPACSRPRRSGSSGPRPSSRG